MDCMLCRSHPLYIFADTDKGNPNMLTAGVEAEANEADVPVTKGEEGVEEAGNVTEESSTSGSGSSSSSSDESDDDEDEEGDDVENGGDPEGEQPPNAGKFFLAMSWFFLRWFGF